MLQLIVLSALVIATFFGTRALAATNRALTRRDAAAWYRRGQNELAAGSIAAAIEAFRRASVRNRSERQYTLALAHALALNGETEAARSVLVALRTATPEDRDVNLELARLAAAAGDLHTAVGYYHNALYASWPVDADDRRRRVRIELIRLLIASNDSGRAQSELFVLSSELPDDPAHHIETARLFTKTGDYAHALDHYQRALRLDADNHDALTGAGQAAFQLGNYRLAQTYLHRVPMAHTDASRTRELVDTLLASDPWAARIGSNERRRRLLSDFSDVAGRLEACAAQRVTTTSPVDPTLLEQARSFGAELRSRRVLDQETIEAAFDVIDRIERDGLHACGAPTILDQALAMIARQHGSESK
jgi:tetratricopeptide (TPR) repeat protein